MIRHSSSAVPSMPPTSTAQWQELAAEELCRTPHLAVRKVQLSSPLRPQGREWIVVHRKPAVVVIPRLSDGRYLLIRQERPAVRQEMCEFPAGQVDEAASSEVLETTARRELLEETGFICPGPLRRLGHFFSSPGFTDENQTIFLAEGVIAKTAFQDVLGADADEAIAGLSFFSEYELRQAIRQGVICDANTLVSFSLLCAYGLAGGL